jgi:hypothetical protein
LRRGAKLSLPDDFLWATPLALATSKGHTDVVEVLRAFASTGVLPGYRMEVIKSLVDDLVAACKSGEAGAFQRIVDHFYIRRWMTWDRPGEAIRASRLRGFVRERLPAPRHAAGETIEFSDARLLIARSFGFESWRELETSSEVRAD